MVVLVKDPVVDAVTLTVIEQVPFPAMVPFEKEMEVAPAAGAKVGVPQLVVEAFAGFATTRLVGNGSTKLNPLMAPALGLVNVMVKDETPFTLVGLGLKLFAIVTLLGSMILAKRAPKL